MKTIKKLSCTILAMALVMLSALPTFAATDLESEILAHSFKAYQIFSADSVEGQYLTNVDWGSAFARTTNKTRFLNGLVADDSFVVAGENIFADCTDAESIAKVLADYDDYSDVAKSFAKYCANSRDLSNPITVKNGDTLDQAGYYIFVDAENEGSINPTIVKMVADGVVNIEVKASVPQVEKKVKENTYNVNYNSKTMGTQLLGGFLGIDYGTGYNDAADYSIGDSVPFELIGSMASTMNDYEQYYYSFIDTLSPGLTFTEADADAATVTLYDIQNGAYTAKADVTDRFDLTFSKDRTTNKTEIKFSCNDILEINGITPTSILVVNYNATLNDDAVIGYDGNENEVYLEYSNNPATPKTQGKPSSTSETEKDKVIVFTYELDVTKFDTDNNTLEGAEFYLQNENGMYYSTGNAGSYWVSSADDADVLTSNSNGVFVVKGLDKGVYTLTEINAPDGFKVLAEGIEFEIEATILPDTGNDDAAQTWNGEASKALTAFAAELTENPEQAAKIAVADEVGDATVLLDITNTKVYDLPGTGGMGTTLIYVIGGMLLAGAAVLIVVKRRAK